MPGRGRRAGIQEYVLRDPLARYECLKKTRPPSKARFGSLLERLFGTTNTQFIHNLLGNTQITRNVRQVTKSVNPKGQAVWPITEFYDRLCHYLYRIYNTTSHPALGENPQEAYRSGLSKTGQRPQRAIAYDEDFLIFTLPTTTKGTAQVSPGRGVKINYIYYWSDAFRNPEIERQQVAVRYDPSIEEPLTPSPAITGSVAALNTTRPSAVTPKEK